MRNLRKDVLVLSTVLALGATACGNTDNGGGDDNGGGNGGGEATVSFSPSNLPAAGSNHQWEGWIVAEGEDGPVSTGTFELQDDKDTYQWTVDQSLADNAQKFVLSLEPQPDDDPAPSATKLLAGDFSDSTATADIETAPAVGKDMDFSSDASNSFLLNTPSTPDNSDDYNKGIWWLTMEDGSPTASLSVPALGEDTGWQYEGWVVDTSGDQPMPISTGTFKDPAAADSDGGGENSGDGEVPPFPGQDFINNNDGEGLTLTNGNYNAVVSIEPQPDNAEAPFVLKPLSAEIPEDASQGQDISLNWNTDNLPEAAVTLE
jgi:hypothetical protein